MRRIKLFCLPYAGGSSNIYAKWKGQLDSEIEVQAIELAGRGKRFGQALYDSLEQVIEDAYSIIEKEIDAVSEYAVFGHSMGGIIAYELIHRIKSEGKQEPMHVFFSGTKAPNLEREKDSVYDLPDKEFKQKILELGGTPKEVLENEELLQLMLPILRADFKINGTYQYCEKPDRLNCNITVLYGKNEDLKLHEITEWRKHSLGKCNTFMLEGDHFFINTNTTDVLKIVNNVLMARL